MLRGLARGGKLPESKALAAISTLEQLDLQRFEHTWYLPRIWELRSNMASYDAAFIALSEALGLPLLTADKKFGRVPGTRCQIVTV
ncbi:type II toxin-antitoxin system VapC family toxin [Glycomyces sp. NPDC049804]|uniref:type II toxin-antitoxin system VapC family toxin n=1 Tax=Glycomyces sp. NPDC049804 TaxID=3154363 RepID=UPI0034297551